MLRPTVTLLGSDGSERSEDVAFLAQQPAPADVPFISCSSAAGVKLTLPEAMRVAAVQLLFLGCGTTDVWNSWLRAPRIPQSGALRLLLDGQPVAVQEDRLCAAARPVAPVYQHDDAVWVQLQCTPQLAQTVEVRFAPGAFALARMVAASLPRTGLAFPSLNAPDWPHYPPPRRDLGKSGDVWAQQLRDGPDEPTRGAVGRLALPYRGGALLGCPGFAQGSSDAMPGDSPLAYQLWDGTLLCRPAPSPVNGSAGGPVLGGAVGDRVLLHVAPVQSQGGFVQATQRLCAGHLPAGEVTLRDGALRWTQRAFVDEQGALRVELRAENSDALPRQLRLWTVGCRRQVAVNDRTLHAEVHTAIPCQLHGDTLWLSHPDRDLPGCVLLTVPGADTAQWTLRLPLREGDAGALPSAVAFDRMTTRAAALLGAGAQLDLPDAGLQDLWRALLLQLPLFTRDGVMQYGLFPGVYEGGLFGVEEGWDLVALSQYGHSAPAQAALRRTFLADDFLKREGPHHQYRNGLAITYALDVCQMGWAHAVLHDLWPTLRGCADWIVDSLRSTRDERTDLGRAVHAGLMPKHIYGGDLRRPAYSLYATSACWRGLRDAARVATTIGENETAAHYLQEAARARADLHACAAAIFRAQGKPPYLPFATDEDGDVPGSGDYYQLFASLVLETAAFGWSGSWARILTDYLDATGRMVVGVPRFDVWFGRLAIDAEYARGALLAALHRREFDRFYLGVIGQVALSCDPFTFVSPETAVVLFSRDEYQDRMRALSRQGCRADSDPCSAGTGVMLQYLRSLLVFEERDEDDLPTGPVWLGAAAPPSWFAPGVSFGGDRLPTLHGQISYRCHSDGRAATYDIETSTPMTLEAFASRRVDGQTVRVSARSTIFPRGRIVVTL